MIVIINLKMYLRFHLDVTGKRVYTFKFHDAQEDPTLSAHPGKFDSWPNSINSEVLPRRCLPEGAHEVQREIQPAPHPEARYGPLI